MSSILNRTAVSAGWVIGWRMATRVLGLGSTLVLVRVLLPGDFGLVALGSAFATTVDAMSSLGTDDALVRERDADRAMYDTAFTLNAIRGLLTGLVLLSTASTVAVFFSEPRLTPLLMCFAALAVIDGFVNTGIVDFRRNFQFHKEFILNILPRLISVGVTIGTALAFHSFWALIAGQATFRILRVGASYRMHPYRPGVSLKAWRGLMIFSAWTWALSIVQIVQMRVDAFVIGRTLDSSSVGAYALGAEVATLPTSEIVDPLGRAAYSGFSATRREGGTNDLFYRLAASSLLITGPIGLGLSMVADPLVRIALGEKWLQVVPIVQVLSLTCGIASFGNLAFMLLRSYGRLAATFCVVLMGLAVKVTAIWFLLQLHGLTGAAEGAALAVTLESVASFTIVAVTQRLSMRQLLARCWRILVACAAMVAMMSVAGLAWTGVADTFTGLATRLAGSVMLGATAYAATGWVLWIVQGRPEGAEADMLGTLAGVLRRMRSWARRPVP